MNKRTTVYYYAYRPDDQNFVFLIDEETSWIKYYKREWHVNARFVPKQIDDDYDDHSKFRNRIRINRMGDAYFFWWN